MRILLLLLLLIWPQTAQAVCGCERPANKPLYITPHLHMDSKDSFVTEVSAALKEIEPKGAHGKVQVGYMAGVLPLTYYQKDSMGNWVFNRDILRGQLANALLIDRPFVVYLKSNHFLPPNHPLIKELAADPANLMRYADGSVPQETYFDFTVNPFVISTDPAIPYIKYLFNAIDIIAEELSAFNKAHPGLLVAVTLNGETHYIYPDFMNGTGQFENVRLTDYSAPAIGDFKTYLQEQGKEALFTSETDLKAIPFNRFEGGDMMVSGWVADIDKEARIAVYLNDSKVGEATRFINRMDVYEAQPDLNDPNTGFVYWLDYRDYEPGTYRLTVFVEHENEKVHLGSRTVFIEHSTGTWRDKFRQTTSEKVAPTMAESPEAVKVDKGWLDFPKDQQHVGYNPLAEAWLSFRSANIQHYIESMAERFKQAGLPDNKIYSYQFAPFLLGNWNPILFGVDEAFFRSKKMLPGIDLYAGNIDNPNIWDILKHSGQYAVPEMHPQMNEAGEFLQTGLCRHYCGKASFIAPYFLRLGEVSDYEGHRKMCLRPDNETWSSNSFLQLITNMANE